jgi:hypothetical protein
MIEEEPPPAHSFDQVALMAAEGRVEFLTPVRGRDILLL